MVVVMTHMYERDSQLLSVTLTLTRRGWKLASGTYDSHVSCLLAYLYVATHASLVNVLT